MAKYDANGVEVKSYGYRPDSTWTTDPLWLKYGGEYYFYQNDHLGAPQKLVAQNGAVVWSAQYRAFGEASIEIDTVTNNLRFPGQYYDAETGLHYNWFRYYDPVIGRYTSVDPIGFFGGDVNVYAYGWNAPNNRRDPHGLKLSFTEEGFLEQLVIIEARNNLQNNSPTAKKLIKLLDDIPKEEFTVFIKVTHGISGYNPTTQTVYYNPFLEDVSDLVPECTYPWCQAPAEIGLIHELIHAWHDFHSPLNPEPSFDEWLQEEKICIGLRDEESDYTENTVREEYDIPLRDRVLPGFHPEETY